MNSYATITLSSNFPNIGSNRFMFWFIDLLIGSCQHNLLLKGVTAGRGHVATQLACVFIWNHSVTALCMIVCLVNLVVFLWRHFMVFFLFLWWHYFILRIIIGFKWHKTLHMGSVWLYKWLGFKVLVLLFIAAQVNVSPALWPVRQKTWFPQRAATTLGAFLTPAMPRWTPLC